MRLEAIACFIRSHKSFLISVHTNLDGDALGSELAFARLLKKIGKRAMCVNDDDLPYGYDFLPGVRTLRRYRDGMKPGDFDCMAVLDCSDLRRTGKVASLAGTRDILNIDHHISNSKFGDANLVVPKACCTCELIYALFRHMGIPIDRNSALLLYAGILTDTGSFRYSNTQPSTHRMAAELLATGVRASEVYKKLYASVPYEDVRLLSRILPTMRTDAGGKIVWFQLPRSLFHGRNVVSFDLSESILNFARSVKGVEVALLFKENPGHEVRVNFRSQGVTDVNRLAAMFGGGGHRTAAGATIRGTSLERARRMVLKKVRASFE